MKSTCNTPSGEDRWHGQTSASGRLQFQRQGDTPTECKNARVRHLAALITFRGASCCEVRCGSLLQAITSTSFTSCRVALSGHVSLVSSQLQMILKVSRFKGFEAGAHRRGLNPAERTKQLFRTFDKALKLLKARTSTGM